MAQSLVWTFRCGGTITHRDLLLFIVIYKTKFRYWTKKQIDGVKLRNNFTVSYFRILVSTLLGKGERTLCASITWNLRQ